MHIIYFLVFLVCASSSEEFFVSHDGKCDQSSSCKQELPCSLFCPFKDHNKRLVEGENNLILMLPGVYNLDEYELYGSKYHLAEISKNNIKLTIKPYLSSDILIQNFPNLPPHQTMVGSIFFISGKYVNLEFMGFEINNLNPKLNKTTDFEGYLFSTTSSAEIDRISFLSMNLNTIDGFFSGVGNFPPFSMSNITMREMSVKNTTITNVNTPIYIKLSSSDGINSFHLTIEDCEYVNIRTDFPISESQFGRAGLSHFGVRSDGFVTIYGEQESPSSKIFVEIIRTTVTSSSISSVVNLIDLMGDTDFVLLVDDCDFSNNYNIYDVIFLSLSQILMNMTNTIISQNVGIFGNNLHSILTMDELELFEHDLYHGGMYYVDLTLSNVTISHNEAFSILSFPFLENYQMFVYMNFSQTHFLENTCNAYLYPDIPYRQSAIFTFTQLGSYKTTYGDITYTDCTFKSNSGFRYIIYFSTQQGFLPFDLPYEVNDQAVMGLSRCTFESNFAIFSIFKYHPYGPQPSEDLVKETQLKVTYCDFVNNKAERIFEDQRDQINYLTDHDFPILFISHCKFHKNIATEGSVLEITRPKPKRYAPAVIVHTTIYENSAVLGGGIYGENVYIALRRVYVNGNTAEFGGGFFLRNSVLTDILLLPSQNIKYEDSDVLIDKNIPRINVTIVDNVASKSGGGLYCSRCSRSWLDTHSSPSSFLFGNNRMGSDNVQNSVMGTPIELDMDSSHTNQCRDQGGKKVWTCHLYELHLYDRFGQDIIEPSYEDIPINYTVFRNDDDQQVVFVDDVVMTSRRGKKGYYFLFFSQGIDIEANGGRAKLAVEFEGGQVYDTDMEFKSDYFPFWVIPLTVIVLVINAVLVIYILMICVVCTGFLCFAYSKSNDYKHEKNMKDHFDNYDQKRLRDILSKKAQEYARKRKSKKNKRKVEINLEEEEEIEEVEGENNNISDEEVDISIVPTETDSLLISKNIQEEEDRRYSKLPNQDLKFIFSAHHVFMGNPNGKAGIYYFHRNTSKSNLYPVFKGLFHDGLRHGRGEEFHCPSSAKQKPSNLKLKFEGMYREDRRHGKGKEWASQSSQNSFVVGEWEDGVLCRVIWNNHPVTIIDLEKEVTMDRLIYPKNPEDARVPTRIYLGRLLTQNERDCVVKVFRDDMGSIYTSPRVQEMLRAERLEKLERNVKILSLYQHPNIIEIYGWTGEDKIETGYVMEKCEFNLIQFLRRRRRRMHNNHDKWNERDFILSKMKLLLGIAKGMVHLHRVCGLIHRDLKASNILIDRLGTPKIIDFEMCVMCEEEWSGEKNRMQNFLAEGSPYHISPECLDVEENYSYDPSIVALPYA